MSEEYEPILRRIRELEERIATRQETIEYFEEILRVRREETGLSHIELFHIDPAYRRTVYAIRALRGWQTRDRKEIEKLKKLIPPIKALKLTITFSIETGRGHEPFYAEVTCQTIIPIDTSREQQTEIVNRIINAVIKLFWILFDTWKDVTKDKRDLWGAKAYDTILRRGIYFQKHAKTIYEEAMDNFLKALIKLGCLSRDPEEYVTTQAIIKIGLEVHPASPEDEPKYPTVNVLIEKGRSEETKGEWIIKKQLIIAPKTDVNIMEILEMRTE